MSTEFERPPRGTEAAALPAPGGLSPSPPAEEIHTPDPAASPDAALITATLASLPVGARLVMRCRRDWRVATVSSIEPACVRLSVASPTGHTYRVRRPADSPLTYEGALPLLGEVTQAGWRAALARYDVRW
ncbi:MAG TPA: hypothetical protein VK421_08465 [Pyrinomonadaceae bacterium]|nr:hypothetical protein [Pyrinomonadaceae bacterium]